MINFKNTILKKIEREVKKTSGYYSDGKTIYDLGCIDSMLEEDEISPEEAGFMEGYDLTI